MRAIDERILISERPLKIDILMGGGGRGGKKEKRELSQQFLTRVVLVNLFKKFQPLVGDRFSVCVNI